MFHRPFANKDTVDKSMEGNEPDGDELRESTAYYGSTPGFVLRLEPEGEDLIPKYDTNDRVFVVDPKDGKRTYIVWG